MDVVTLGAALSIMKKMPDTAASSAAAAEDAADRAEEAARTLTIDDTLTEEGQAADAKAVSDALAEKLDITDLPDTVDNANQLLSEKYAVDTEPYHLRPSGGNGADREFDTIVGGSVVWNQLVQNGNFADGRESWTNSIATIVIDENNIANITTTSGSGGIMQAFSPVQGHVVFVNAIIKNTNGTVASVRLNGNVDKYVDASKTDWQSVSNIIKYDTVSNDNVYIRAQGANASLSIKSVNLFDLTAMFGSAIADYIYSLEQSTAGAGVNWFRSLFPNDYYEYNAGELMSVSGLSSHDTVGFNKLEENIVVEYWYNNNGAYVNKNSNYAAPSSVFKVIPNTEYCFSFPSLVNATAIYFVFFDENQNFIGKTDYVSIPNATKQVLYSPGSNVHYMSYFLYSGSVFKNDEFVNACVNISDPTRNGEYEPYTKHSYPLDSTLTLRGIPKLDADNQLYYDGDTYESNGTVTRRYGVVDLGTLTWTANNSRFNTNNAKSDAKKGNHASCVCPIYVADTGSATRTTDKAVSFANNGYIYVYDTSYTDATAFKSAMSGVMLVYELEEPTTEIADPFPNPQIVDASGTEEYVSTSIVPVGHETRYPENLRAKIEGLPWDFSALIAPTEATYKATRNYTTGSLFIVGNTLYKATANIANEGTITPGTNCVSTTLAEIIAAL